MSIAIFYFSGTGNSKFIAELFAQRMGAQCVNIEAQAEFADEHAELIIQADTIAFCYPVYGSRLPRLMREFVEKYSSYLNGKNLIIFCTQMIFSGDGARCLTDLLPGVYYTVTYAEHFLMPNNINNFFLFPITNNKKNERYYRNAQKKMGRVCLKIKSGKIVKRGFHAFSKCLGLMQGAFMPAFEEKGKHLVTIDNRCTRCGVCINACPTDNLKLITNEITASGNCMFCYRCANLCPQKAIKLIFWKWPKKQYMFPDRHSAFITEKAASD